MKQYVLNTTTYGIHAHSHEVLLVAGEGFEPSKAEPGDLQSVAMRPRILVQGTIVRSLGL